MPRSIFALALLPLSLAACGMVGGAASPAKSSSHTPTDDDGANDAPVKPTAFADRDEGSAGPIQDHHGTILATYGRDPDGNVFEMTQQVQPA